MRSFRPNAGPSLDPREEHERDSETCNGLVPAEVFSFGNLLTLPGFIVIVLGGFLVGFGARYAGGCTSGHAITGLSNLQKASLFATLAFFIGGLLVTHFIYPILF